MTQRQHGPAAAEHADDEQHDAAAETLPKRQAERVRAGSGRHARE